jgi:hypothetical protein
MSQSANSPNDATEDRLTIPDEQQALLPEPNLTAELTYLEWCVVLAHLGGGRYCDVAPIINRLMARLSPQANAQQQQAILAAAPAASDSRN